jgi:hypothetical protein
VRSGVNPIKVIPYCKIPKIFAFKITLQVDFNYRKAMGKNLRHFCICEKKIFMGLTPASLENEDVCK